jgi:uncharacterized membrane protein
VLDDLGNRITIWALIRWLHLLGAIVWVGGQLFIVLVLLPVLRAAVPATERAIVFARVGRRYATVSWVALALLVVTGVLNAERRNLAWTRLTQHEYGRTLHYKLELVGVVIVLTLVHAFYFGRRLEALAQRARDLDGPDPELERQRRRLAISSGILSAVNLLLNLAIVLLAASLIA